MNTVYVKNALLLCMILMMVSCKNNEPIKIGFVGGLSGRNGDLGTAGRDGAILAVEAINASGGINGRKIELVVKDDKSDPEQGKVVVNELVQAGVKSVIGPMTSSQAEAMVPLLDSAALTTVSPTVSSVSFNGKDDLFFHLNLNQDTAAATADYMFKVLKIAKPAVIYDVSNKAYTATVAAGFKEGFFALGGGPVTETAFNSKEKPDLMKIVMSSVSGKPDAFFVIAGSLDSAMLCQQLRKAGLSAPVFISEWAGTNEFLKSGGTSVTGVRVFQHFNADSDNPAFVAFKANYSKRFGEMPTFAATYSHEAVLIVSEALRKNSDPQRIKETIIGIGRFKGLQGDFELDKFGDPKRSYSLMQVTDNRFSLAK